MPQQAADDAGPTANTSSANAFVLARELAEVHLLLDNISSSTEQSLTEMTQQAVDAGLGADWIEKLCQIKWPPENVPRAEQVQQAALVIKAKDFLNRRTHPATGATIAFTLLVTAEDPTQGGGTGFRMPGRPPKPKARSEEAKRLDDTPSRTSLACQAYPGLVPKAKAFRTSMLMISVFLLVWLVATCAVSWYAAFGNATLAQVATATAAVAEAEKEVRAVEVGEVKADGPAKEVATSAKGGAVTPLCDRWQFLPRASVRQYNDVREMQACRAYDQANDQLDLVRANLSGWLDCGPLHCRGFGDGARRFVKGLAWWLPRDDVRFAAAPAKSKNNEAYYATILATILATAVLPVLYAFLGAGAAIVRNLSYKMQKSLLAPRDWTLSLQRLALGAVVGACISLFVATPGDAAQNDPGLLGTVALSGSALSFIAGFSVEAVFSALEALINRVFSPHPVDPSTATSAR